MPETKQNAAPAPGVPRPLCPYCRYPPPETPCAFCDELPPAARASFFPLGILEGLGLYFSAAFDLLNAREYLGRILFAVLLNGLAFLLLFLGALYGIHPLMEGVTAWLPAPLLRFLGIALALALTLLSAWFLSPVLMTLFLFPVLDPISRIAESRILGWNPPGSGRGFLGDFWDSLETAARILVLQIAGWILCILLTPLGIGLPLGILASAWFAGFSWLDYPLARRGFSYGEKRRWALRNLGLTLGLGLGFQIGMLIPFFNLLLSGPAAAAAAGKAWFRLQAPDPL